MGVSWLRGYPTTRQKLKGVDTMTNKTQVVSVRLPNEVVEWLGKDRSAREIIEGAYFEGQLNLRSFRKACKEKHIDCQLAIDRTVKLIREEP